MGTIYEALRPLVFLQDPEKAHNRVLTLGKLAQNIGACGIVLRCFEYEDPRLETVYCGTKLKNPVGLAAGFDKNAEICEFIGALGFGFMEVGSITLLGGEGNPKPRILRLPEDYAIINRMGLNNQGAYQIKQNLDTRRSNFPVFANIAKTHSPDIVGEKGIEDFWKSYLTINLLNPAKYLNPVAGTILNISCPNTTEGKTFEDPVMLKELLSHTGPNVSVKISPDLSDGELDSLLQATEDMKVEGYVVSNTSAQRHYLSRESMISAEDFGKGGLSGAPIRQKSTEMIRKVYRATRKPIIGAGGIFRAEDAYEKIMAGAAAVEVYTGMIFCGPGIAREIKRGLVKLLERDDFRSISEAIGYRAV